MRCPYCGHNEDRVLDTREQKEGTVVRRRRECLKCKSRYSTIETISFNFPLVIKKDGRREPFSREKILGGIQAACQKRPVSLAQIENIVDRIAVWVINRGDKEVSAKLIGQKVIQELRFLDDVAYVRFASVYRTFKDIQEFVETLDESEAYELADNGSQLLLRPEAYDEGEPSEATVERTRTPDSLPS